MAAYSDTVVDDGNAAAMTVSALKSGFADYTERAEVRSSILSTQLVASVVAADDANGADLHFQFDDVQSDANADALVHNERRDLLASVTSEAQASAHVGKQVRTLNEPVIIAEAQGNDFIVRAGRVVPVTLQEDAGAAGPVVSQRLIASVELELGAQGLSTVEAEILRATETIEQDAFGDASEPNFFVDSVFAYSSVVQATMHVKASFTDDANAQATRVSDALKKLYQDTLEDEATGEAAVSSQQLAAVQEVVGAVDAVDELLNVLSEEAWVFNSWTLAFSRYVNFGVNDGSDVGGKPLFASPKGVHEFSDTVSSDARVQFGLSNMGSMSPKRMRAVYVTTAGRGIVKLATLHGLQGVLQETNYVTPVRDSAVPINRRINPARGHQGQYWGFRVELTGGRQTITRIHVLPLVTGRNL